MVLGQSEKVANFQMARVGILSDRNGVERKDEPSRNTLCSCWQFNVIKAVDGL